MSHSQHDCERYEDTDGVDVGSGKGYNGVRSTSDELTGKKNVCTERHECEDMMPQPAAPTDSNYFQEGVRSRSVALEHDGVLGEEHDLRN